MRTPMTPGPGLPCHRHGSRPNLPKGEGRLGKEAYSYLRFTLEVVRGAHLRRSLVRKWSVGVEIV